MIARLERALITDGFGHSTFCTTYSLHKPRYCDSAMSIIAYMRRCTNLRLGFAVLALIIADGNDANKNWGEQYRRTRVWGGSPVPTVGVVRYGESKTVDDAIKSADGHFEINAGKRQASRLTDSPYPENSKNLHNAQERCLPKISWTFSPCFNSCRRPWMRIRRSKGDGARRLAELPIFTFAICCRPSVCLSVCRMSVCL